MLRCLSRTVGISKLKDFWAKTKSHFPALCERINKILKICEEIERFIQRDTLDACSHELKEMLSSSGDSVINTLETLLAHLSRVVENGQVIHFERAFA